MKDKTEREEWTADGEAKGQVDLTGEPAIAAIAVESKTIVKFTAENDQAKLTWTDEAWEKATDPEGDPVSPRAFVQARLRIKSKTSISGDDWNNQVKAFTEKVEVEMN